MPIPILIEHVVSFVIVVLVTVMVLTFGFVAGAIGRRRRRERYFEKLDELRHQVAPLIAGIVEQTADYPKAFALLQELSAKSDAAMFEQLCVERLPPPDKLPVLAKLCEDLGLVKRWQAHVGGLLEKRGIVGLFVRVFRFGYLERARAAESLVAIRHRASWPLLVKALSDPHPDVREVALRGLGTLAEPESFPALAERLQTVILKPDTPGLAFRTVKAAIVNFPLSMAAELIPTLKHQHRRIRFLTTDVIREMVEKAAASEYGFTLNERNFSAELLELFLNNLSYDENADVRARAAPVIAYFRDIRAVPVLLSLLEDPEWFVRLHTVRALAKPKFETQLPEIARRLADPRWMVREAAVRTLQSFGAEGTATLYDYFLSSEDRYSREQIADEWQRAGLIPGLLAQYAGGRDGREHRVLEQLAHKGKTSYVVGLLLGTAEPGVRKKFLEDFGRHPDGQIQAWVSYLAAHETDAELRALAQARRAEQTQAKRSR